MKTFNFFNHYHLGDCLVSLHFLNKLVEINEIKCNFYCNQSYHSQLIELIDLQDRVLLYPSNQVEGINLWCSNILYRVQNKNPENYPFYCSEQEKMEDVVQMVYKSYELICEENNLISPFKNKIDVLFDEKFLKKNSKIGYFDFILINSDCLSGQIKLNENQKYDIFSKIIENLIKNNKTFITTKKHSNYPCTQDFNLTIGEIGRLSKKCTGVIGFPTSPFWITLNRESLENNVKYINITNDGCTFEILDNITTVNSNFEDIELIINSTYKF